MNSILIFVQFHSLINITYIVQIKLKLKLKIVGRHIKLVEEAKFARCLCEIRDYVSVRTHTRGGVYTYMTYKRCLHYFVQAQYV